MQNGLTKKKNNYSKHNMLILIIKMLIFNKSTFIYIKMCTPFNHKHLVKFKFYTEKKYLKNVANNLPHMHMIWS